jgi:O-antigen/teichoic acid export membrane protein
MRKTSLKKGVVLNWVNLALNFGTTFLLTPVIIGKLGASGYGMWTLIQSFAGYYGLVNLGLASAMIRFIARDLAKDNPDSLQQTVSTSLSFFSITAILVLAVAACVGDPAAKFFNLSEADASMFAGTLFFCAIAVVCEFFGGLTTALITARERFELLNYLGMGRLIAQTTGILVMLQFKPSTFGLALITSSVGVIALIIGWTMAGRLVPQIRFTWRGASMARLKELLGYGSSTVLMTISNIIRLRIGNLIIARTTGMAAVATFSVASNLVLNMNSVMAASLNVLNPRFTRLDAAGKQEELQKLYRMALFGASTMAGLLGMLLLIFSDRFIMFWLGAKMMGAVPIIQVLTVSYVIALAQGPSWNLMFALSKHHYMARVSVIEAGVVLALGLWFSHLWGAIGFAYATAGALLVSKISIHPLYAAKIAGLSLRSYLAPMVWPLTLTAIFCGLGAGFSVESFLRTHGVVVFLGSAAATTLAYVLLVWLLARKQDYFPAVAMRFFKRSPQQEQSI